MNAVEIEEAVTALAFQPFDDEEFPFALLEAFGNKPTTLKKLRAGASNKSDVGGVLQSRNIHIKVAAPRQVKQSLAALHDSRATDKAKARFLAETRSCGAFMADLESGFHGRLRFAALTPSETYTGNRSPCPGAWPAPGRGSTRW